MSIIFEEEHHALRASTRQFLQSRFDSESVRSQMASDRGFDQATWQQMAQEMGLQGLALPEEFGGSGAGPVEQLVVWEEMGKALAGGPYLSSVGLAAGLLRVCPPNVATKELLNGIADGTTIATVGFDATADFARRASAPGTRRTPQVTEVDGRYLLTGDLLHVPDGNVADVVLAEVEFQGRAALFVVSTAGDGVRVEPLVTVDMTRKQAHLHFDSAVATPVVVDDAAPALERGHALASIAIATEQLGGAQSCLNTSVEYACTRSQFNRKIGSFQAIKHRCADMLTAIETARSAVYHATGLAAADPIDWSELLLAAPMAKALASEAYTYCARQNIQIHGGIGCTWEHDAHLHYRRAHASTALLGGIEYQRELLADRLGI